MVGYPKHLNSKEDYLYVKANFPSSDWKKDWQNMYDARKTWMTTGEIPDGKSGIEDDTHKVFVETTQDMESGKEKKVKYQQELKDDPASDFFSFGFTEDEVLAALKES